MDLISEIVKRAKANKQRIVLPEGTEERTLKAILNKKNMHSCCANFVRKKE